MMSIFLLTGLCLFVFGLQAVVGQNDREKLEYNLQVEYDKLMRAQEAAEEFSEKSKSMYIAGEYGSDWLLRAISPKLREKWADRYGVTGVARTIFDKELNKLSSVAAKKLPSLKPGAEYFKFHGNEEEQKMKEAFDHPDQMKIHKIGLSTEHWKQEGRTSEPQKMGYVWASNPMDDHKYCRLYTIRVSQSRFGDSIEVRASILDDSMIVGCP